MNAENDSVVCVSHRMGQFAGEEVMRYAREYGWGGPLLTAVDADYCDFWYSAQNFLLGLPLNEEGCAFYISGDGDLMFGIPEYTE